MTNFVIFMNTSMNSFLLTKKWRFWDRFSKYSKILTIYSQKNLGARTQIEQWKTMSITRITSWTFEINDILFNSWNEVNLELKKNKKNNFLTLTCIFTIN